MRQNQNPILRCAVAEGKSSGRLIGDEESRTDRQRGVVREEVAERSIRPPRNMEIRE